MLKRIPIVASVVVITVLAIIAVAIGYYAWREAGQSPEGHIGPLTGVVLDAETRKPIEGAQAMLVVSLVPRLLPVLRIFTGDVKTSGFPAQTDSEGRYKIGLHRFYRSRVNRWEFVVYKSGYYYYHNQRYYDYKDRKDFKEDNNLVLLEKFDYKDASKEEAIINVMGIVTGFAHLENRSGHDFYMEALDELFHYCIVSKEDTPEECERRRARALERK